MRGHQLWIPKGYALTIFKGRSAQIAGAVLIVMGALFLGIAWLGVS